MDIMLYHQNVLIKSGYYYYTVKCIYDQLTEYQHVDDYRELLR